MRVKKVLAVVCAVVLSFSLLAGCGQSDEVSEQLSQLAEMARQEGYNQCYLEMVYEMGGCISEEGYNEYLQAKLKYESDKTLENLNELIIITQKILRGLSINE